MLSKTQSTVLTVLGGMSLALVVVNMFLYSGNRGLSERISGRSQYVQQSLQLEGIYQSLVRGLAELAARNSDEQLRELLVSQGITFTVNPPQPAQQK